MGVFLSVSSPGQQRGTGTSTIGSGTAGSRKEGGGAQEEKRSEEEQWGVRGSENTREVARNRRSERSGEQRIRAARQKGRATDTPWEHGV